MRKNKGFTLVELIIVLAIMAVLTAILVPAYLKYVAMSREQVCQTNIRGLEQECLVEIVFQGGVSGADEAKQMMADVLAAQGKAADAEGRYAGVCPARGTVSIGCDETGYYPYLVCSEHGSPESSDPFAIFLKGLSSLSDKAYWNNYWNGYVDNSPAKGTRLSAGASIDSEASFSAATASQIVNALKDYGVDTDNSLWRVYRKENGATNTYNIFWANGVDVSSLKAGDTITVTKYDKVTDSRTTGTVKVVSKSTSGQTFLCIDGSSFQESGK